MVNLSGILFSQKSISCPKVLFRHLLRQCKLLPAGPREHYQHFVRLSFKQHVHEQDPERIQQIIDRSLEDAEWILKKYKISKDPASRNV